MQGAPGTVRTPEDEARWVGVTKRYEAGRGPHFAQIPFALFDDPEADALTIAVYGAIRRFTDFGSERGAKVSDARLAKKAGCSVRTVVSRREWLREHGWLEWTSKAGGTNEYVIHASLDAVDSTSAPDAEVGNSTSAPPAEEGTQEMQRGSAPLADNQETVPRDKTKKGVSPLVEPMFVAWRDVTGHPSAELIKKRESRLNTVAKRIQKAADGDALEFWRVLLRCMWSDPWRRETMSRHEVAGSFTKSERIEEWIEAAQAAIERGSDGSDHHHHATGRAERAAAREEEERLAAKRAESAERSEAEKVRRQVAEDAAVELHREKLRAWYRAQPMDVKEAIGQRVNRQLNGRQASKTMKEAVFISEVVKASGIKYEPPGPEQIGDLL